MCEEQQRLSVEEVVDSRGNIKLLNDEDNLEFIQQEQVQNSTVEQTVAVPVPRLQPRSFTTRVKAMTSRKRATRMIKKPVIRGPEEIRRDGRADVSCSPSGRTNFP